MNKKILYYNISNTSHYNFLHNKHIKNDDSDVIYYFLGSVLILFLCILYCKTCVNCRNVSNRRINNINITENNINEIEENNNVIESRQVYINTNSNIIDNNSKKISIYDSDNSDDLPSYNDTCKGEY